MLVVDMHTTNGTWHANHLTYAPSYHSAGHAATSQYTKEVLLPQVQHNMLHKHQLNTDSYGNYDLRAGWPPQKYYTYNHHPRYLVNQFGLRNRMAILSETFAHDKFYQRIQSAYNFALEIVAYTNKNGHEMVAINQKATTETIRKIETSAGRFQRGVRFEMMPDTVPFSLRTYDYISYKDSLSKMQYLRQATIIELEDLPYYSLFRPTLRATVPLGYHIPAAFSAVVQQLQKLGVVVQRVGADTTLRGEKFVIQSLKVAEYPFEHHHMIQLEGQFLKARQGVQAGDYLVDLRQNLAYLIFYLLEPQSDDGLARWNFLDKYLYREGVLKHKVDYPFFKYW
jgi:dipeptidyl-peptidase-4